MSSNEARKNKLKILGSVVLATLSVVMATGVTFAWHMTQSKANITGSGGVIRDTTAMTLGVRYFTGNGTLGGTYEGYDSSTVSAKTINYADDPGNANDLYFAEISTEEEVENAFNFAAMRPGKKYSFAFEESGKAALSVALDAFAPSSTGAAPYLEMYTGPLAIADNIQINTASWLTIHNLDMDDVALADDPYHFMGYARMQTNAAIARVASGTNTHQIGSIKTASAGDNGAYDIVLFGDMTFALLASDQTTYVASTTSASSYKLYGYSDPQGMETKTGADETTSSFKYVNQATIDAWNTTGKHTKYVASASAIVGYSKGYALSATASTNNANAAEYIGDTLGGTLKDKINYRFREDIDGGQASGNADAIAGESESEYELGTLESEGLGTSQIVFVTFSFSNDNSDFLKIICRRGDGASEKFYYAYHPQGSLEPYYGLDAGMGNITLS